MVNQVLFPITVTVDDGTVEIFENSDEAAYTLEWFDTDRERVRVVDQRGRRVHLKIKKLETD